MEIGSTVGVYPLLYYASPVDFEGCLSELFLDTTDLLHLAQNANPNLGSPKFDPQLRGSN